jgi:predicted phosphohydrolase
LFNNIDLFRKNKLLKNIIETDTPLMIYAIADLHLSLANPEKSMNVFRGWKDYIAKIRKNFGQTLQEGDTLVIAGDTSWGMSLEQSLADFHFLEAFPGRKILIKGNHDYFWTTKAKMQKFFSDNCLHSFEILHNNCIISEGFALCGTRGWINDGSEPFGQKMIRREAMRLETSLAEGEKTGLPALCFLHYPPLYAGNACEEILSVLKKFKTAKCYYGHIHDPQGHRHAFQGIYEGTRFRMISADYLDFAPLALNPEQTPQGKEGNAVHP